MQRNIKRANPLSNGDLVAMEDFSLSQEKCLYELSFHSLGFPDISGILKMELMRFPWQIQQPNVHTQEGVKALLTLHLSRLTNDTQSHIQYFLK